MVLDTSALYALLTGEPESARMVSALEADPVRLLSAATLVEIGIVVEAKLGEQGGRELDELLRLLAVDPVPLSPEHAARARNGYRRFGKGRHPAALNLGDTFSYALAATTGEPLLFKGTDFAQTDVSVVEY